ncbi:MAG: right-handed parallel beta-helix repeat-containing protein [Candidatus Eisenbacteria sp.]|nr:right-handed parallel beta-helix repeat-containing protein [Candidatus Eisenbacteria bacterium]
MRHLLVILACSLLILGGGLAQAATLEVSQPVQVTANGFYERAQSIVYDGTDYWLFYGRSASVTGPYSSQNPDVNDYVAYYKKASSVADLDDATATVVSGVHNAAGYMGETGAAYFDDDVWCFMTIDVGGSCDLYGWYYDGSWNEVGPFVTGMSAGQGHHDEVVFDNKLWILEASGGYHTMHSSTPTNPASFSTPLEVASGLTGGLGHFFVDGGNLYLALGSAGTYYIYQYDAGDTEWDLVDSKTIAGYYDPTLYKVGSNYVFHCAPYSGGRQWIVGWTGTILDGTFFDGDELAVVEGQYGSNVWVDMWPIGFTDNGGTSYLFYTSERDEPTAEGTGNIWYLKVDWDPASDHYTYIQEAIDAALSADVISVADGIYAEYIHVTTDNLTIEGSGIDQSIIDLDGLMPYWHYSGCSSSYASRGGVLITGYGSADEVIEDVVFRGFTVKNAGLNPPGGGGYVEFVDPGLDGQDDVRGIAIQNGKNVLIDDCKVQNSGYFGIAGGKARCTSLTQSEGIAITNCVCVDNCNTGISIGDYVGAITITGNTCTNNKMPWTWYDSAREYAGKGIEIIGKTASDPPTGIISGNTCIGNGYQGIVLKNYSNGMMVRDNIVSGHNLDEDGAGIFFYARSSNPAYCVNDTIWNNALSGNIRGIVGYYAQSAVIEGNTISTDSGTFDPGQEGIKLDGCNGCLVTGNTLTDCDGTGIKAQNTWDSVECHSNTVTGNTITNANGPGIRVSSGAHDNAFTGNTVDGAKFAGVFVYLGAYDNTFTGNLLTGVATETFYSGEDYEVTQGDGIFLWGYNGDFDATAGTGNVFHGNGVYGNAGEGIENQVATMTVDASSNWWGTNTPTGVDAEISDYVDYTPWLNSGADGSTDPGFQGDFSVLNVDDDSPQTGAANRIQEGVDLVSASTVNVANGTYSATTANSTEWPGHPGEWWFVTIDESLELIGESRDGVIIDGTALQTENRCTGIWVSASNVTVKNLTIQNFTQTPVTAACYGLYVMAEFRNYTWGDVALLSHVTAENVRWTGNMYSPYFMKTQYATVKDCISENGLGDGIWIAWGSDHATVQGNTITNAGDHGIWVGATWMGPPGSNNATITDNTVNGAREGGISFVASEGATISGNAITNVAGSGWSVGALSLKDGPTNVTARYNRIHDNDGAYGGYGGTGHGVGIDGAASGIVLEWNAIYDNAGDGCHNYSTVTVDAKHCWWGDATGPGGVGPGSGDEISTYVDYDPWIGKTGGENIVCLPDPLLLTAASPGGDVTVRYLGGGSGLLYGYSVKFSWAGAVVSTNAGAVSQGALLSGIDATQFYVTSSGTNELTVDCVLLGDIDGATGPGDLFTVTFTGLAVGTSPVNVTVLAVRDKNNQPLSGFYEDDGEIQVDVAVPTIAGVAIENVTLTHTNEFIKDTDAAKVTATVIDDDPTFGIPNIRANLVGLGAGAAVPPNSYDSGTGLATWTDAIVSVDCPTPDGTVTVTVSATDPMGNPATPDSDVITSDNTVPTPLTGLTAAPGHQKAELSWDNPTGHDTNFYGVTVRWNAWGDYPEYTGGEPAYPQNEGAGSEAYDETSAGTSATHSIVARDIYYYGAFIYDIVLHYSGPEASDGNEARSTNYWLGDVRPHLAYDGYVGTADISALSGTYRADPLSDAECDVGPTHDYSGLGIPQPDGAVDFDDLMIFALNYGEVGPTLKGPFGLPDVPRTGPVALELRVPDELSVGSEFVVHVVLEDELGIVQGTRFVVDYDEAVISYLGSNAGALVEDAEEVFFRVMETQGKPDVNAAVLGHGMTFGHSGELVQLRFRCERAGAVVLKLEEATARNSWNEDLFLAPSDVVVDPEAVLPSEVCLQGSRPNPMRGGAEIAFGLPETGRVQLVVYDVGGRMVRTLATGEWPAGMHAVRWDRCDDRGEPVGAGLYFCRLETQARTITRKMIVAN